MTKMTQGTFEDLKRTGEALPEEKKKAIENYMRWTVAQPDFQERLVKEIMDARTQ